MTSKRKHTQLSSKIIRLYGPSSRPVPTNTMQWPGQFKPRMMLGRQHRITTQVPGKLTPDGNKSVNRELKYGSFILFRSSVICPLHEQWKAFRNWDFSTISWLDSRFQPDNRLVHTAWYPTLFVQWIRKSRNLHMVLGCSKSTWRLGELLTRANSKPQTKLTATSIQPTDQRSVKRVGLDGPASVAPAKNSGGCQREGTGTSGGANITGASRALSAYEYWQANSKLLSFSTPCPSTRTVSWWKKCF